MDKKLTYIDLFAGCGGLSLGLEQAGFDLVLAVEKSDMAGETFYHNFIERIKNDEQWERFCSPETPVMEQAKKKLVVKELQAVLDCDELINELKEKEIDLIAGGPPCQGFSLAGRRNPDDIRNQLPWQFLELVEKVLPKAVIIENVSGMSQNFVKHDKDAPFEQLRIALSEIGPGYLVQPVLLNAMHYGAPQHRPRVMLLAVRSDIEGFLGLTSTEQSWKSEYDHGNSSVFKQRPDLAPPATHFDENILTVRDAIWDLDDSGYATTGADSKYRTPRGEFAQEMREDISWMVPGIRAINRSSKIHNHNLRNHSEAVQNRFRLYQYFKQCDIPYKVLSIPKKKEMSHGQKVISIKELLANAVFPAMANDGMHLADDIDGLVGLIMELGTRKHSQRPLDWDSPSPTIVSLPDDFVHPSSPRTLTVREMARFQSFPDSFEFRSKETTGSLRRRYEVPQYTQVGNAVPPKMAKAVGNVFYKVLTQHYYMVEKGGELKQAV